MFMKNELKTYKYLLLLAMLLWGGGWTALKILTYTQTIEVIVFWRFFLMSLAFIPILYFFNKPITLNRGALVYIGSSSILNILFMVFSFIGISSGFAGSGSVIITTFSPILTFILFALLYKKQLTTVQFIALFLGLLGGFILLELDNISLFLNSSNIYFLLCALVWAGVTLLSQHSAKYIHPVHYSFFISLVATMSSFIYAFDADLLSVFDEDMSFWVSLIYLAVFGQTIATTIFFMASSKLGSQVTSSFMFLVPVFALASAWLVLDEPIEMHIIVGGFVSMLAVYYLNKK
ncbi:DMT family transporter [Sulfurimonas sp. SAG-AH-194-L11]|nr:DMT family transporter [Sulfurimonas sp. SAG-AH-194-L11]